ncbi:MAG: VOC family protein [Candidatus Cybelea sp.]|jgi:catechol 2,3-dioxygenase-like lactoylglutathione lyase family enzyme
MIESIDHIQLAMPRGGEDHARSFYGEVLGMAELPKPPELRESGGVWFQSGAVFLHLGVADDFHPATKAHPALNCTAFDALLERLGAHGIAIARADRLSDGRAHCYIADPFGNRLELIDDA